MNQLNMIEMGEGPSLLMCHGWGFDHTIWQSLVGDLASRFRLYLVDLPGFGQSDFMGWEEFCNQLFARLPVQFLVAGWSMGGLYATRLAIEFPNQITHLFNITTSPYFIADENWPGVRPEVFEGFFQNLVKTPQQTLKAFMNLQLRGQSPLQVESTSPDIAGLSAGLNVLNDWDFRCKLSQIKIPVSYVFGRLDAIVPYKLMKHMQSAYPHFHYYLFPRAAHAPFLSDKEQFLTFFTEFML